MGAVIAVMQTKGNAAPAFVKYLCAAKAMTRRIIWSAAKPANFE